jgi:peroxiredoxin
MQSLERRWEDFEKLGTVLLGISVDTSPSKRAWAKELGIRHLRLLADFWPHGGVAASLGLFRKAEGTSMRANVILDESGRAIFVKVYPIPELPDVNEILAFLREKA